MQGLETYCGNLKESPLKLKPKKAPPLPVHRIVTLDGIMEKDNGKLGITRNISRLAQTNFVNE